MYIFDVPCKYAEEFKLLKINYFIMKLREILLVRV